eukprot:11201558-Lingulodinium_polyedra.AAC.1
MEWGGAFAGFGDAGSNHHADQHFRREYPNGSASGPRGPRQAVDQGGGLRGHAAARTGKAFSFGGAQRF